MERLQQQMSFIIELDKLKSIYRRTILVNAERCENSAEHSWHIAIAAMMLSEYANQPVDILRVLKMLLIHDIVEIDAGDTYIFDEKANEDKKHREQLAAERIFSLLPSEQKQEAMELWQEFEEAATEDAKFANSVDRLLPLFHNFYSKGKVWQENKVSYEKVQQINDRIRPGSEKLWEYAQDIMRQAVEKKYLSE